MAKKKPEDDEDELPFLHLYTHLFGSLPVLDVAKVDLVRRAERPLAPRTLSAGDADILHSLGIEPFKEVAP